MSMAQVNELFGKMWSDFQRFEREREEQEAKKNPEAYRNSQVMERGKSTAYRFYDLPAGHARKGETVRFCYTKHRNVAGFYLSFTQIVGPYRGRGKNKSATIVNRNFHGWPTKQAAIEDCRFRYDDARKPEDARSFIVPTLKDHFGRKRRKPKKAVAS